MFEQAYGLPKPEPQEQLPKNGLAPNSPFLKAIFMLQTVLCTTALILCLILKYFAGDLYTVVCSFYRQNIAANANIEEVIETSSAAVTPAFCSADTLQKNMLFYNPMPGTVTSGFGYRTDPFTGAHSFHSGYDIGAAEGTAVCAAMGGQTEIAALSNGSYGNYVVIKNGAVKTLYGHLKTLTVAAGETVTAGQPIGQCGSTGRSTGAHLHFEIQISGQPIDPAPFLNLL